MTIDLELNDNNLKIYSLRKRAKVAKIADTNFLNTEKEEED